MAQPRVQIVGTNEQDYTITVLIHDRRIEFFIKPDYYNSAKRIVRRSIDQSYYNQAISTLVTHSNMVHFEGNTFEPKDIIMGSNELRFRGGGTMSNKLPEPTDFSKVPTDEYRFTMIAPTAKNGLVYQGQRYWHKSIEAATEYAKYIYQANRDENFTLTIVEAVQNIQPEPTVKLQATSFKRSVEG